MREYFEKREQRELSPIAVKSSESKGRKYKEPVAFNRTCFQRDRDRIIHSKAFRRLKHKTQVFVTSESDHFRSRLTHSIEVAQISRHIARLLSLNEDLAEAIALAHDLGHTPFGHAGEKALSELMQPFGGFEHNMQSLRTVDILENKYPHFPGLNLSYEVKEGLIKHTSPWDNPNKKDHFVTLEAQVVNLADEISYNNHDLDDGLTAKILVEKDLEKQVTLWCEAKKKIKQEYTNLYDNQLKYLINSYLISSQIVDVVNTTQKNIKDKKVKSLKDLQKQEYIVCFSKEMKDKAKELRLYLFSKFYTHHSVYRMNKKGQSIVTGLFKAFSEDIKLLPEQYRTKISSKYSKQRVCSDYIAGMTDTYAYKEYHEIYN